MATKLDKEFVSTLRRNHQNAISEGQHARQGFETLVYEVNRLEAYCEELEKRLTPDLIQEASVAASKRNETN